MVSHKKMYSNRLLSVLLSIAYSSTLFSGELIPQKSFGGCVSDMKIGVKSWWSERSFREKCIYGGVGLVTAIGVSGCGYAWWKHRNSFSANNNPSTRSSSSGSKPAAGTKSDRNLLTALAAFNMNGPVTVAEDRKLKTQGLIDLLQASINAKNKNAKNKNSVCGLNTNNRLINKSRLIDQFVCVNRALEELPGQEGIDAAERLFSMWSTYCFIQDDWIALYDKLDPQSRLRARIGARLNGYRQEGSSSSSPSINAIKTESDSDLVDALISFNSKQAAVTEGRSLEAQGLTDLLKASIDAKNKNGVFEPENKNRLIDQFESVNNALQELPKQERSAATERLFFMGSACFAPDDWANLRTKLQNGQPQERSSAASSSSSSSYNNGGSCSTAASSSSSVDSSSTAKDRLAAELESWNNADFADKVKVEHTINNLQMTANQAFACFMNAGSFASAGEVARKNIFSILQTLGAEPFFMSDVECINNFMLSAREFPPDVAQAILIKIQIPQEDIKAGLIKTMHSLLTSTSDLGIAAERTVCLIKTLPDYILAHKEKQELLEATAEVGKGSKLWADLDLHVNRS